MSRCGSLRWARRIGSVALAIDLAVWAQLRACGSDSAHHRRSAVELAGPPTLAESDGLPTTAWLRERDRHVTNIAHCRKLGRGPKK